MRYWPLLILVALAGCSTATASKVGTNTYSINGPVVPGGSSEPDRRLADKICPKGFRVIDQSNFVGGSSGLNDRGAHAGSDSGLSTNWTIRCL